MPKLKYKCDWSKIKEKALSRHQQEYKIGSVMQAVKHAVEQGKMENPYAKYEQMQEDQITEVDLHASHGTKLQEQGGHVLEFDLAGSGYKQFQSRHAGLDGEDHYYRDGVFIPFEDIDKGTKWEVHWWNKLPGFLRSMLGIASEGDIRTQNEVIDELEQFEASHRAGSEKHTGVKKEAKAGADTGAKTASKTETKAAPKAASNARSEALIRQKFGERSGLKGLKDKKYIYVKDKTKEGANHTKTYRLRYSIPGSQSSILGFWKGARNKGEYNIQNVSEYMLTAGKQYLETIFKEWDKGENPVKKADDADAVTIMIKGHSRGGVAAAQGAMMLKYWLKTHYPRYEDKVRFKLLQLDPVAGFGSDHGIKERINLKEENRPELRQEMAERRMAALGDAGEATLVYSLHTNHSYFFSPQSVDGAKQIILTAANHGVNLGAVDASQKEHGDTGAHRKGYLDLSTGEMYRSSGLHELPEGIYIADENNRLIKVPNLEAGRSIINEVLENTSGQKTRHERIDEVMKNWFEAHRREKKADPGKKEKEKISLPVKRTGKEERIYAPESKNTEIQKNAAKKGLKHK